MSDSMTSQEIAATAYELSGCGADMLEGVYDRAQKTGEHLGLSSDNRGRLGLG